MHNYDNYDLFEEYIKEIFFVVVEKLDNYRIYRVSKYGNYCLVEYRKMRHLLSISF